jgi:hypothetical protein
MRRVLSVVLVSVFAILGLTAVAGASDRSVGADVYGVGGGTFAGRSANFDVSMHRGPNGSFGHLHLTRDASVAPIDLNISVTCVHGDLGLTEEVHYTGRVQSVSPVPNFLALRPGDPVSGYLSDGGNPSSGVPVDAIALFQEALLFNCDPIPWTPPANDVSSGNIQVKLG